MALTEAMEVVGWNAPTREHKHIQVREQLVVRRDGVEIARGPEVHARVLTPDMDVSGEDAEVRAVANAVWTPEVKAAWAAVMASWPDVAE